MSDPRLLVPLEELLGFDATGLAVVRIHDSRNEHCIYDEGSEPEAFDGNLQTLGVDSDRARWQPRKLYAVSFADASTRDRAARWLAGRKDSTAHEGVRWRMCSYVVASGPTWALHGDSAAYHTFGPKGWFVVEELSALDGSSNERLPDGSRVVDAVALALVCQHVGRTT